MKTRVTTNIIIDQDTTRGQGVWVELAVANTITLAECADIVSRLTSEGMSPIKSIEVDLTRYSNYNTDGTPVLPGFDEGPAEYTGKRKIAIYWPEGNTLRIWADNMPIYENANGVICRDQAALSDCLL